MAELEGYRPLMARLEAIGKTEDFMRLVGLQAVAYAKQTVAHKTRTTSRSIRLASSSKDHAVITAGGAGAFLEFGTRPHIIRPRNKKALFFPSQKALTARAGPKARINFTLGGRVSNATLSRYANLAFVHAKIVHHPGTRKQPFLIPAAQRAVQEAGLDSIVKKWNGAA